MVVAAFVVLGLVGAAVYAAQSPRPKPQTLVATETPSWTLESDPGMATSTSTPRAHTPEPSSDVAVNEVATPEEVRRVANRSLCPAKPPYIVNVLDYGARGDGQSDDSKAIQRANDAVAATGGRVVFPSGVYRTYDVKQDSCVEFRGQNGATLIHPDGTSPANVVSGRVRTTTGSIGYRSSVLTVANTRGLRPGVLVAVQGAGGSSRIQRTRLSMAAPAAVTTLSVHSTKGLPATKTNYLIIENELISYNGISGKVLRNVRRGLFGTTRAKHNAGSTIAQAQRMYAMVVRVSGNSVILAGTSWFAVHNARVDIGSVGMSVTGLTINGRRQPSGSSNNPFPLKYDLARRVAVEDSTFRSGDHGGLSLDMGTRDSRIDGNLFVDQGDPSHRLGSAIWLFRGASHNVVSGNTITGWTFVGITADDRSIESTEYDADSNENVIEGNTIDIPSFPIARSAGVLITGATRNTVAANIVRHAYTGVMIHEDFQGSAISQAVFNRVRNNSLASDNVGILVTGSDNEFLRNLIRSAATPMENSGERNRFTDNTVEP